VNGKRAIAWLLLIGSVGCYGVEAFPEKTVQTPEGVYSESTFGDDLTFLQRYGEIVVLTDNRNMAKVAISAAWQGRVMTSTAQGDIGRSLGWINREHIASRKIVAHMNVFGGEERFWIGPEGGQFSIFHGPGKGFGWDNWQVPPPLDSLPFELVTHSRDEVVFRESFPLVNYSGTNFQVSVKRTVRLLDAAAAWARLGLQPAQQVSLVAYESNNILTNSGTNPWQKETGLLSIWIAGMHPASRSSIFIVPIRSGSPTELGTEATSDYFLPLGPDRLKITNGDVIFRVDARYQSKIGISPKRSLGKFGSYDPVHDVLTIVIFSQPQGVTDYVKSLWRLQESPFSGDAINSYNDGPATPGARPFGPFYEMESSSPAAALATGASIEHSHLTIHLVGSKGDLDRISRAVLGVSLHDASAD
jgi:hypothetical protein